MWSHRVTVICGPAPGGSKNFVMFAGPSVTFAAERHMRTVFGISPAQASASGLPLYSPNSGFEAVGFGFSVTRLLTTLRADRSPAIAVGRRPSDFTGLNTDALPSSGVGDGRHGALTERRVSFNIATLNRR